MPVGVARHNFRVSPPVVAAGVDPMAAAWFAACATAGSAVSAADQGFVNTFATSLRAAGLVTIADRIALLASSSATQALIDLKSLTVFTATNSPTFASYGGYTGNGTSSYVDLNFIPASAGGNFSGLSASMAVYTRTSRTTAQASGNIGSRGGTGAPSSLYPHYDTSAYFDINSGTEFTVAAPANVQGLWTMTRNDATTANIYQNTTLFAGPSGGGTAPGTTNDHSVLVGTPSTAGDFSTDQNAFAYVSSALTAQNVTDLYNAVQALATSQGWNV